MTTGFNCQPSSPPSATLSSVRQTARRAFRAAIWVLAFRLLGENAFSADPVPAPRKIALPLPSTATFIVERALGKPVLPAVAVEIRGRQPVPGADALAPALVQGMILRNRPFPQQFQVMQAPGIGVPGDPNQLNQLQQTTLVQADRNLRRRLKRIQELLDNKNYLEATQALQQVLDRDEEVFLPAEADDKVPARSLKTELLKTLSELPPAAQDIYETQFGPLARRLLETAIAGGQPEKLQILARRYLRTQAGAEGAYRLAGLHFDQGEYLPAAQLLERLRQFAPGGVRKIWEPAFSLKEALAWQRLGETSRAWETIRNLPQEMGKSGLKIAGQESSLLESPARLRHWLEQHAAERTSSIPAETADWLLVRGDPTHTVGSAAMAPYLNSAAKGSLLTDLMNDPAKSKQIQDEFNERYGNYLTNSDLAQTPALPSWQPLIVGSLAIVRTLGDLRAYHLDTGKLAWAAVEKDDTLHRLTELSPQNRGMYPFLSMTSLLMKQRIWRDNTYGHLSSDGPRVYSVEESGFINPNYFYNFGMSHPLQAAMTNRLKAYDVRTGRLVAEFPSGGENQEASRVFFLGPPLPLQGKLYALAEAVGEIRLLAFRWEDANLELEWSQPLVTAAASLAEDPFRRMAGLTPAYRDGVLFCPTEAGAVVAFDLATRSLVWGNVYSAPIARERRQQLMQMQLQRLVSHTQSFAGNDDSRWLDSAVIATDQKLVLTLRDQDELHCLNMIDGKLLWKRPREEGLFVACVHNGLVAVVSKGMVQSYRLEDGQPAWPQPTVIPLPAGQGYRHAHYYYIPLSTAEVATLDLRNGQIVARAKSREGRRPGNLAGGKSAIVSLSPLDVAIFPQFDVLEGEVQRRLASNPRDAGALALRGEIDLQRGQTQIALASLRGALALKSDDAQVRELLFSSLLEGLRVDFPTYRSLAPEIEQLATRPEERGSCLFLLASGQEKAGEKEAAFATYLRFFEPGIAAETLEMLDSAHLVRRDALVYGRLRRLYDLADAGLKASLDQLLRTRFAAARDRGQPAELSVWVDVFGENPAVREGTLALIDAAGKYEFPLDRELIWHRLSQVRRPETAGAALVRLIPLLVALKHPGQALPLVERLRTEFASVLCGEGKTGAEWAAHWSRQPALVESQQSSTAWPEGQVEARRELKPGNATRVRSIQIPIEASVGNAFAGTRIEVSQRGDELNAWDATGKEWWSLDIESTDPWINTNVIRAYALQHLLIVAFPRKLIAIDTLSPVPAQKSGAPENGESHPHGPARIVWQFVTSDLPRNNVRANTLPGGRKQFSLLDDAGQPTGALGPLTERCLGVQRGRKLYALDPRTGKTLWIRDDVGPLESLAGDDDAVISISPRGATLKAFNTSDGTLLGSKPSHPGANYQLLFGRYALQTDTSPAAGKKRIVFRDIWTGVDRWETTVAQETIWALVERQEVALFDPQGKFQSLRLADGKKLVESQLDPETGVQNLIVFHASGRYVALVSNPLPSTGQQRVHIVDGMSLTISGTAYGVEDKSGKRLWSTPIEAQAINPNQSSQFPVLVFASYLIGYRGGPKRPIQNSQALMCLDTRNGRIVYDERLPDEQLFNLRVSARPELRSVELQLFRSTVSLNFTEKTLPPDPAPPPKQQATSPPSSASPDNTTKRPQK